MAAAANDLLRQLPKVDELLESLTLKGLDDIIPHDMVLNAVRGAIDNARNGILAGGTDAPDAQRIAEDARMRALGLMRPSLRPVINATGVIIHTNLGRSPLSREAAQAAYDVACGYSTLEYNTDTMSRGSRHDHCEQLICALTGAEAAIAVNNNAAAVMMILNEFASGHEAIVSRGEEVEIGGSFRIPDIMAQSKAVMVEVGTTNKTHLTDYEVAISNSTAMLLKVHTSNFSVVGFTESVSIKELHRLADQVNQERAGHQDLPQLLVYEDLGSGCLIHMKSFGKHAEPTVSEHLAQGADLVSFSGDKLLGGPQAGIIVGRKELIDRLKANPLARAMRLDKMTLAALEVTLRQYLDEEQAMRDIPTLHMLTSSADDVRNWADSLMSAIESNIDEADASLDLVEESSRAGGGSLPMCEIPTWCVKATLHGHDAMECARYLAHSPKGAIICRIQDEALLFDARTLLHAEEHQQIAAALKSFFESARE